MTEGLTGVTRGREPLAHVAQRALDATFALFVGQAIETFDPTRLLILEHTKVAGRVLTVEAAIIGESHFLTISTANGQPLMAELLGCVDLARLGFDATRQWHVGPESITTRVGGHGIEVDATVTYHPAHEGRRDFRPPGIAQSEHTLVLDRSFPGVVAPMTRVAVALCDGVVNVRTQHEYEVGARVETVETATNFRITEVMSR